MGPPLTEALRQICRGCDPVVRRYLDEPNRPIERQPHPLRRPVTMPQRELDSLTLYRHRFAGLQPLSKPATTPIAEAVLSHHAGSYAVVAPVALALKLPQRFISAWNMHPGRSTRINSRHRYPHRVSTAHSPPGAL
jgi:hypothetical protein